MRLTLLCAAALAAPLTLVPAAAGQTDPLQQVAVPLAIDSGPVVNTAGRRAAVFTEMVRTTDTAWVRLMFDEGTVIGDGPDGGYPTVIRITGLADGARQTHTVTTLEQWGYSSAYFNGSAVLVQVIADPGAAPSRVVLSSALAGPLAVVPAETICGPDDDRQLSTDDRVGRVEPIGCTGWLIDDFNNCFLTAGHCTGSANVMEFNVPLSDASGQRQHPGPEDQYAIDPASMQSNGGQGVGDDWAYYGCFPNTETGLTPAEAQGTTHVLAAAAPPVSFQTINITGYGSTSSPVPNEWNGAQKTHQGPYVTSSGTTVQYATDTTGGNSGSPVLDLETGFAIGIHTHGGCNSGGGQNSGTAIQHAALQNALANPQGVCEPLPTITFAYPNGLPAFIDPAGGATIRVVISGENGGTPFPGTGRLHYDDGSGVVTVPMTEISDNVYDAVFGPTTCGNVYRYWFSGQDDGGATLTDPFNAPVSTYGADAALGASVALDEDFEVDNGWTVFDDPALADGTWERGVPVGGGDRGDPPTDADGSGQCYLTDNVDGNSDVDGGPTVLTSPLLDASGLENPRLRYFRWFTVDDGDPDDMLTAEISADDGATWVTVESVNGGAETWTLVEFTVSDFVPLTNQLRLRFSAIDDPNNSVTEAGVDGVQLVSFTCPGAGAPGDVDGDGDVDFTDLLAMLQAWGPCPAPPAPCPADTDGNGVIDFADLLTLLTNWG